MSKQVLKNLLEVFDSDAFGGSSSSSKSTKKTKEKTAKLKPAIAKKKKKTTSSKKSKSPKVSQIELYKALRASSARHEPNLKNIKRKFFKHNPDQISNGSRNNRQQQQGSVFSDRDFENFMSK